MADFLSDNTAWLAVVLGFAAVAYGIGLTVYLLKKPTGDERMREIAAAVQEGAQAYLKRQYTIIAGVAAVLFVVIGILGSAVDSSLLGWKAAIGFLIGADGLGRSRLHRHERVGADQRPHRRSRQERAGRGAGRRLQGRGGHRTPGGRPGPSLGRRLLPDPRPGHRGCEAARRPRLRLQPHQRLRPSGRRHLHQGRRRRRRPGGQGRGRHPRGRPAQPGRHRRQCRGQRRRLRRHGRRPLRDVRRHDGGRHVPRLAVPGGLPERADLPARPGRRFHHRLDRGDLVRPREGQRVGDRRALHRARRVGDPRDPRLHPGHLLADGRRLRRDPRSRRRGPTTTGAR